MNTLKTERRWQIRQLIIAVNLFILGLAFYADYNQITLTAFSWAASGFQGASAIWFSADYLSKPTGENNEYR